ncbi:uncharacterized protein C11orf52 homolog isoform X3 [Lepidochelys kempii]|uniref:uncharacterized protein C11orf52 homolog isoform X3 n=1 Tax=Lepidochelys kempii TaxID=8472 RepID=UPI003C6F2075
MEAGATWATPAAVRDAGDVLHLLKEKKKSTKDLEAAHMYDEVVEFPVYATVNKPRNMKRDDSVHYADIQVFTRARERSAEEVKNLQIQNATEYATLNFPHPRLKYDSRNGTLV